MNWGGRILGGVLGALVAGPIGALIGFYIGYKFDSGMSQNFNPVTESEQAQIQSEFFNATFTLMGRLAKADGHVSEQEIENARRVMERLGLNDGMKQSAIGLFQQGKEEHFDWRKTLRQFAAVTARRRDIKQMFLEIQIQSAFADGQIHEAEKQLLLAMATELGFGRIFVERLIALVQAQLYFYQQQANYQHHQAGGYAVTPQHDLEQAYKLLDIEPSASDAEVKKAYRRLMAQNHPDKLVAKGLPEEMLKLATEKTQQIQSAYDTINKHRKAS